MSDKSLYDILGVRADASQAEIRAAYLKLAKQWHPDRNAGNETEAERRFKEIAHAYDVLSDPDKRAAYDAAGGANQQSTASDGSMDDDAAFDLFISVLLDLAFELAASGADQIAIYQALIDMGCPSGTAKTLAQRAHKHGGTGNSSGSGRTATKPQPDWNHGNVGESSNGGSETANDNVVKSDDPDATFPAGPWSRWFARSLDLFVGVAIASPFIGLLGRWLWTLDPVARLAAYVFLVTPIPFVVDAIIVGMFGNSLGKALLKIKVVTKTTLDGNEVVQPIGFGDTLFRNLEMWLKGFWGCIPFVAAIPQFMAYLRVSEGRKVAWDVREKGPYDGHELPDFEVVRKNTRWELIAAFVVCSLALPAIAKVGAELFTTTLVNVSASDGSASPDAMVSTSTDAPGGDFAEKPLGQFENKVLEGPSSKNADINLAASTVFKSGETFYENDPENQSCSEHRATVKNKKLMKISDGYDLLISLIQFDSSSPQACLGFIKIDLLGVMVNLLENEPRYTYNPIASRRLYQYGFGGVSSSFPEIENRKDGVYLTHESGYTAQGYTTRTLSYYRISPSGISYLGEEIECINPDGETKFGEIC